VNKGKTSHIKVTGGGKTGRNLRPSIIKRIGHKGQVVVKKRDHQEFQRRGRPEPTLRESYFFLLYEETWSLAANIMSAHRSDQIISVRTTPGGSLGKKALGGATHGSDGQRGLRLQTSAAWADSAIHESGQGTSLLGEVRTAYYLGRRVAIATNHSFDVGRRDTIRGGDLKAWPQNA